MLFPYLTLMITLAQVICAKNILLTNDDSWVSTNIRATYRELTLAGHNVVLVAPVSQRSGYGGKFDIPKGNVLQTNGEFDYVKAGEPAWGHEVDDQNVWYFNGTPASCVAFALKYVLPKFFNNMTIDLVVSGPNEGTNMGQGFYTGLGTMGATYNSIYRGIPGVAFSGSNSNNSFFKDSLNTDPMNPSNIYASKVVEFVAQIFKSQGENPNALPITSGINVNFPPVGNQDTTCTDPEWVLTRMSGELSATFDMAYNETSNTFVWSPASYKALTVCENGDCSLPSANEVLTQNCRTAVSVFSIDYDAKLELANEVKALVQPILSI